MKFKVFTFFSKQMKQRRTKEDEESLLRSETAAGGVETDNVRTLKVTPKIPSKAIKSIIVAILLVLLGFTCLVLLVLTYTGSMYYAFGEHRFMLFSIGLLTISYGSYTLYIAYNCYHMVKDYRWPMLFL